MSQTYLILGLNYYYYYSFARQDTDCQDEVMRGEWF